MKMADIERLFDEAKQELNSIEIPEEMESRLRSSLNSIPDRKGKTNIRRKIAVLIVIIFLISYNADTLAYYGKKLIGYDNIMTGTLQELNELGKGQIIGKAYTFKNGASVTLDGIMLDDNNLIAFYTIKAPQGNVDDIDSKLRISMEGLFGDIFHHEGQGEINDDGTEMKWISVFDKPGFFEKKIKFNVELSGDEREHGLIEFKIDRNKAMGHNLKISIDKMVEVDQREIKIESLMASPTSTVIKGQIQNIVELGIDYLKGDRFMPESIEFDLLADGKRIDVQSSSISTGIKGSNFSIKYDALPTDTKDIEIKLISFGGYHDVKEKISLKKGDINKNIQILNKDISINKVYELDRNTYINITTDEDLILTNVNLIIDGERIKPERTIIGDYEKIVDGDNVKIKYTRDIEFKGTGKRLELEINRIKYNERYDKLVYSYK